jgi:uncharacterized tellurite resistance protein B-like protein
LIRSIKQYFDTKIRVEAEGDTQNRLNHEQELATAALLIEVSRADLVVKEEERAVLTETIARTFHLTQDETIELIRLAEEEVRSAVSLYQFTCLIDKEYSIDQKKRVVQLLWKVAFSDNEKNKYEEHLIRRIADLLHVSHRDFIDAKIRAREARHGGA